MDKLKQARNEAEKELAEYQAKMDIDFQRKVAKVHPREKDLSMNIHFSSRHQEALLKACLVSSIFIVYLAQLFGGLMSLSAPKSQMLDQTLIVLKGFLVKISCKKITVF